MSLLIGTPLILVSLWVVANDPTIKTWRRHQRLAAELRPPLVEAEMEGVSDLVAVYPLTSGDSSPRHQRHRTGGRMKPSFRSKPSYQKRKTR